jgi:flagellar basal body-associated protein FliL
MDELKKQRKTLTISIIIGIVVLLSVVGATYAYFDAQIGTTSETSVTLTTRTTDSFTFTSGDPVTIYATQENFGNGAGNIVGTSIATATLTANSASSATYCYTINLAISQNNFVYSINTSTPELTFSLTKNGTSIISNLDVTTAQNTIQIPTVSGGTTYKHSITSAASQTTTDTFNGTLTFINLGTDQQQNTNKTFAASLQMTRVACS